MRDTLWPVPAAMTAAAVLLALVLIQLDEQVLVRDGAHRWWLFSGGAAGARGVLGTIAATSMAVATTAFSITIVALQLGSSQFSPRILRGFTGDRGNQVVLGVFVATFAYALVVLRAVRTATDDQRTFVPGTAVTMAIVLAFVMIGALIFYFHHATRTIQAPVIVDRAVRDTRALIGREIDRRATMTRQTLPLEPGEGTEWIAASAGGYLQRIDLERLAGSAGAMGGAIRVDVHEGEHLLPGMALASTWAPDGDPGGPDARERRAEAVRSAFTLGMERTLEHDVDLGFRQVSDIALRALSPGINDPTTAMLCVDRMAELLVPAMELRTGRYALRDDAGQVRVAIDFDGFEEYLGTAFDQIRHYGAGDAIVIVHLLQTLEALSRRTSNQAIRATLMSMAELTVAGTREQDIPAADRARVTAAGRWAIPGGRGPRDRDGGSTA